MPAMYATAQDFIDRYGEKESNQLSNRNAPTATGPDTARLELALLAASGIIDSWIGGRYQVPVQLVNAIEPLRYHCLVLARCDLDNITMRDKVQHDCELTYDWLKRVADGKINLAGPVIPNQPDLSGQTAGPSMRSRGGKVSNLDLSGY